MIAEIAKLVWHHSHPIPFGNLENWNGQLFTKEWGDSLERKIAWRTYGSGWYWFLVDMSLAEVRALERPSTLPLKGCDMGALSRSNWDTFGAELLCKASDDGRLVVYNGQDDSVCSRVRAHFTLENDRTGALGIKHFPLHHRAWEVRAFAAPCLTAIPKKDRPRLACLMKSKSGRRAVETAWRSVYGWPVLCKE